MWLIRRLTAGSTADRLEPDIVRRTGSAGRRDELLCWTVELAGRLRPSTSARAGGERRPLPLCWTVELAGTLRLYAAPPRSAYLSMRK